MKNFRVDLDVNRLLSMEISEAKIDPKHKMDAHRDIQDCLQQFASVYSEEKLGYVTKQLYLANDCINSKF